MEIWNNPIQSIDHLDSAIGTVLLMKDKVVTRFIAYNIMANQMGLGPVWGLIVAPPSGGKSELVQATFDLDCVYPLSSLTPQTLISGMKGPGGQSASLLDELDKMVVVMKDATTIVEMNKEDRRAIMAQLREIYDKRFDKAFGTGERKRWEGHVGMLAAITPAGAEMFGRGGAMGERFIYYRMEQPDRNAVVGRAIHNEANNFEQMQVKMRNWWNEYLDPRLTDIDKIPDETRRLVLDNSEVTSEIIELTDFATRARSNVDLDPKTGHILYVHPHEMPTRFAKQLTSLSSGGMYAHTFDRPGAEPHLDKLDRQLLSNIAFGSVPPRRTAVLDILAQYREGTTKAIASRLGYETDVARVWLTELAALQLVNRTGSGSQDTWSYKEDKERTLVCKYRGLEKLDESLSDADSPYQYTDADVEEWEKQQAAQIQREMSAADKTFDEID